MRHLFEIAVAITALSLMAINNPTPAYAAVGGNVIINIDIPTQEETLPETEPETTVQETETEPSTEVETTAQETTQEETTPEVQPSTEVETTQESTTQSHHDYDDSVCLPDGDVENDRVVYETIQDSSLPQETETTVPETSQAIPQPVLPKMGEENTAINAFWVAFAVAGLVVLSSGIVYAVRRK